MSNWHQVREADPRDYRVHETDYNPKERNLTKSTYKRIGTLTDMKTPMSTCHDQLNQIKMKADFEEKIIYKPHINEETFHNLRRERFNNSAVLPPIRSDRNRSHYETTYGKDYSPAFPLDESTGVLEERPDIRSAAYKRCHSQFTDPADSRRRGQNTWQDESGVYANTEHKREVFKPTNTIPERLV